MKNIALVMLLVSSLWLSGCATTTKLSATVKSDPPGATIYSGNTIVGTAPLTVTWPLDKNNWRRGQVTIKTLKARWLSGAEVVWPTSTYRLGERGNQYIIGGINFIRPSNAPNADIDARFAIERQKPAPVYYTNQGGRSSSGGGGGRSRLIEQGLDLMSGRRRLDGSSPSSFSAPSSRGFMIQKPGRIPTYVTPRGGGGYMIQTPGQNPSYITPR